MMREVRCEEHADNIAQVQAEGVGADVSLAQPVVLEVVGQIRHWVRQLYAVEKHVEHHEADESPLEWGDRQGIFHVDAILPRGRASGGGRAAPHPRQQQHEGPQAAIRSLLLRYIRQLP